jgi:hypothetical protein
VQDALKQQAVLYIVTAVITPNPTLYHLFRLRIQEIVSSFPTKPFCILPIVLVD